MLIREFELKAGEGIFVTDEERIIERMSPIELAMLHGQDPKFVFPPHLLGRLREGLDEFCGELRTGKKPVGNLPLTEPEGIRPRRMNVANKMRVGAAA